MEGDNQLKLCGLVAEQQEEAHTTVRGPQVTAGVRMALPRESPVVTAAAKHDLPDAARRLGWLMKASTRVDFRKVTDRADLRPVDFVAALG